MKLKNILLPILGVTTLSMGIIPMASCSNNDKHTIILLANKGTFGDEKDMIVINAADGKALNKLKDYVQPTLSNMEFIGWTDENGQYIPEDTVITSDMALQANFVEPAKTPVSFVKDSWQTVLSVCDQGYVAFAKAYCGYEGDSEEDAKTAISLWSVLDLITADSIEDVESVKPVVIKRGIQSITGFVHVIGFDQDTIYGTDQKTKFTFEFMNIIDVAVYSNDHEFHHWYQFDGNTEKEAFLRKYLNEYVYNYLPIELRKVIKTVDKSTPNLVLDENGMILSITNSHSPEKLFPLDMFENNAYVFLNTRSYNGLPGNAYSFYEYALAYLSVDREKATKAWVKLLYLTGHPMPYWLRTGSIYMPEEEGQDPVIQSIAYAIYAWSEELVACPGSPTDIAFGVAPAFCI